MDMTEGDLPEIESESYEYDGEVALCGRDSDGSGGSANGGEGEGGSGESGGSGGERGGGDGNNGQGVGGHRGGNRGDGNNASGAGNSADGGRGDGSEGSNISGRESMNSGRGQGGFGGLGIGNPKSYGATANPTGYEKSVDVQAQRDLAGNIGKGLRGLGVVTGPMASLAGWGFSTAAKHGRVNGELSDMERAARANGMGDSQGGEGGGMGSLIASLDPNDPAQKALADAIAAQTPTAPTPKTYKPHMTGPELQAYARA